MTLKIMEETASTYTTTAIAIATVGMVTATLVLFSLNHIYDTFLLWKKNFSRRLTRSRPDSPSHKNPPDVVPWEDNKKKVLEYANSRHQNNFRQCELVHQLEGTTNPELRTNRDRNNTVRQRANCTESFQAIRKRQLLLSSTQHQSSTDNHHDSSKGSIKSGGSKSMILDDEKDKELDMDHVYVPFLSFLWFRTFVIVPISTVCAIIRLVTLKIRATLHSWGVIQLEQFDAAEVVGRLCLEGTMAIYYNATSADGKTAGFFFPDFPIIEADGSVRICDLLAVDVDLETKKMTRARLDDECLTPSEAMTLCAFNCFIMHHVKMHSLANWGVNIEEKQWKNDSFVAMNNLATIIYNHLGYSAFRTLMPTSAQMGLIKDNYSAALVTCADLGMKAGIPAHPQIRDLMKHSDFVNFIVKARSVFMSEFQKHHSCFPGIHGEALFVGTVMHGLDHNMAEENLRDPLWLDIDHPRFGSMAGICRIARAGFVEELPFVPFHRKFKGSGHPFYEAVHSKCVKFNKDFADNMDSTIVK